MGEPSNLLQGTLTRRACYYVLTPAAERQLACELADREGSARAVFDIRDWSGGVA